MKKFANTASFGIYIILSLALVRLIYVGALNAMLYFVLTLSIRGVIYWVAGTILSLVFGTLIVGSLALWINKINRYQSQTAILVLTPLIVLLTIYQGFELYKVAITYGFYGSVLSYFPIAFFGFIILFFTVKSYKMLVYNEFMR